MNIKENQIDRDLPVVKPIYDTWGVKKSAGYWTLDGELDWQNFSLKEINNWYVESLNKTINSFYNLARISNVVVINGGEAKGTIGYTSEIKSHASYEEYIQNVLRKIEKYPIAIDEIQIELDMFVFVRTNISPHKPIRAWASNLGDISILIDQEDECAGLWLNIEHTLFYPFSYQNSEDNTELFELNQPLLEEALKNWEQKFNSSIDVEGLPGIYKYGFLPEDQWRSKTNQ